MAHTREEGWYERQQELHTSIYDYHKAKGLLLKLKRELGIKNPSKLNHWTYKAPSLRELAQFVQRLDRSVKGDKVSLGLHENSASEYLKTFFWCGFARKCRVKVEPLDQQIQTVEETCEMLLSVAKDPSIHVAVIPKYFEQMVVKKGILHPTGKATFKKAREWGERNHSELAVLNARELKGKWLEDDGIRAFKVVVLPWDESSKKIVPVCQPLIGYVVRSATANSVVPAFSTELSKAVSLCKRRVKSEFMKQMGL